MATVNKLGQNTAAPFSRVKDLLRLRLRVLAIALLGQHDALPAEMK